MTSGEDNVKPQLEPNGDAAVIEDPSITPPSKRIARYDQYYDRRSYCTKLRKTQKKAHKTTSGKSKKYALIVRRIIDDDGSYSRTEVDVKSHGIRDVLRDINQDVEGLDLTTTEPVVDPKLFLQCLDGIQKRLEEERLKETPDKSLITDLETAVQFALEEFDETIKDFTTLTSEKEITFSLLWVLFKPKGLIYHFDALSEQSELMKAVGYLSYGCSNGIPFASIPCHVIHNDGNSFGLAESPLVIRFFKGSKKIQDLSCYPLECFEGKEALKEKALARGRKFAGMVGHTAHEISGPAMIGGGLTTNCYGRVMIDPKSFRTFNPHIDYNPHVHKQLDHTTLTDDQYMICTPVVLGYCFGIKKWGGFAMDRLQDIVWSDEPMKSLVLGAKHKALIHALIGQHIRRAASYDDFIAGKGKGLIGLLSGRPGCGKTLTAEAISEKTHRVLYAVSAGELGTTPEQVDMRLTNILQLSETWNAVLLLDEADVFLQQRGVGDVNRNALVSIFLRQLEYFQGVLVLTTNMVQQIDPAFESRIHFSVHYPDLDFAARCTIWRMFLAKAVKDGEPIADFDIERVSQRGLNGRQIKNIVGNAQSLALDEDAPLSIKHVDTILEIMEEWSNMESGLDPIRKA